MKVYVFLPARNEAVNLPLFFESLLSQTIKPHMIVVINDGSTDETGDIARSYGAKVIDLPFHAESYTADVSTSWKLAEVLNHALPPPEDYNYMMQISPDILLPKNYIETIIDRMEKNPKLVIAGGQIEGEPCYSSHVRGAGRIYKVSWWNRYIKKFPLNYTYESYPLFKARALGYQVKSFPDVRMWALRPTRQYKPYYGYAMRELGYWPPYAIARCLLSILKEPKTGVKMLATYINCPFPNLSDKQVTNWLRQYQIQKILNFKENMKTWITKFW
mgnify:CR=1 FL=1